MENNEKYYSYYLDEQGTLWVYENNRVLAEIHEVSEEQAEEMFEEIVYEMRNFELNKEEN